MPLPPELGLVPDLTAAMPSASLPSNTLNRPQLRACVPSAASHEAVTCRHSLMGPPGQHSRAKGPPTLLTFLQALEGRRVKVELHNETTVEGRLDEVSDASDFSLEGELQPPQRCLSQPWGDHMSLL